MKMPYKLIKLLTFPNAFGPIFPFPPLSKHPQTTAVPNRAGSHHDRTPSAISPRPWCPSNLGYDALIGPLEHLLEELPRLVCIGIGQRRAGGGRHAQMDELPLAALQSTFDFPQGVGMTRLQKSIATN